MEETITLTICLSMVFVISLGIISCTLRDKNFKARFDKKNERLKEIISNQHAELISYREAIKKNDEHLKKSLFLLESSSKSIEYRLSNLKDVEDSIALEKTEIAEYNLRTDKFMSRLEEIDTAFSSCIDRISNLIDRRFKDLVKRLDVRPSYLSPEERKQFDEYLDAVCISASKIIGTIRRQQKYFVSKDDVKRALDLIGTGQIQHLYINIGERSKQIEDNGQNSERNQ
nr:hypothetical protein [uncultured Prevotella sp.]